MHSKGGLAARPILYGGIEMKPNVGTVDRAIRLIVGLGLIVLALFSGMALFDGGVMKWGAVIVGLVLAGTAMVRSCPMYTLLGIKTCQS